MTWYIPRGRCHGKKSVKSVSASLTDNTVTTQLRYVIANIGVGWVGIVASARGLRHTTLPQPSPHEAHRRLGDSINHAQQSPRLFEDLVERLRAYFSGHEVTFPDELDLSGVTPFRCRVWEKTRTIPYGDTRSYTWVAGQIKQPEAVRAVGQALGKNPLPIIIPCHRVITAGGKPGGYSEGLEMKEYLLHLETSAR